MQLAKIEISQDGPCASVKLNGIEIGQTVSAVEFKLKANEIPTVTLELVADSIDMQSVGSAIVTKLKGGKP